MGKLENDQKRKLKNEHFLKAFEYVAESLKMNQGELAKAIGSKSAYISNYKNGIRPVKEEDIDGLIQISKEIPNGQIFKEYLLGHSDIMLLVNVTDEDMAEANLRHSNPDYDVMQERLKKAEANLDQSLNKAIPFMLQDRLTEKDKMIKNLEAQLKDKEEIIFQLRKEISELYKKLDTGVNMNYHFPIGVADEKKIR